MKIKTLLHAGDDVHTAMRPSTRLRAGRLREVIEALSVHPLDIEALASLLGCSTSAIRNYLHHLIDAGVVVGRSKGNVAAPLTGKLYRLNHAPGAVEHYLTNQSGPDKRIPTMPCPCQEKSVDAHTAPQIKRDPLVAALFGGVKSG